MELTELQYKALANLYHEFNGAFMLLPQWVKAAYYKRLYRKD